MTVYVCFAPKADKLEYLLMTQKRTYGARRC
jgi:hypothetical protein